jgi:GH24 family phage-related lysozyme (muramidase)
MKFIVYLDSITAVGSVGPNLSFKIKIGQNPMVSVGDSPKKKKVTELLLVPRSKNISLTIDGIEQDPIPDLGQTSGTLSLLEKDEFEKQKVVLKIQGAGRDKKKSAVFTLWFYMDLIYSATTPLFSLIEKFEAFRAAAYLDDAKKPTIGIGHLIQLPKEKHFLTATLSREQAIDLLKQDVAIAEKAVNDLIFVAISQKKFNALVSLVYNIGRGNFAKSQLRKAINTKVSPAIIKQEWSGWCKVKGVISPGLVSRRADELALYF